MRIVKFSTRRPVTVFVFTMATVVFGLVAFRDLAVDLLPEITYPSLTIRTLYEGAAPSEVENLVTRPVENSVGVVNGVLRASSSSRAGVSEITLEFGWDTNMDMAALDVRERLDFVELPDAVSNPILLRYDPSLDPVIRIGMSGDDDLIRLRRVAEQEVERALERVENVAAVVVSGGLEEEIHIELNERRLANLGLTVTDVSTRLAQENVNLTGGRLEDGQTEYLVRTINEIDRASDIRSIVIGGPSGTPVRLEEVAEVIRGYKRRKTITRINGQESVEISVYKEGGANSVTVVDAVLGRLEGVRSKLNDLNSGLELTVITDQARYIRQAIQDVLKTAIIGGSLAILVLLFFLRSIKATLIIGISIPISVIATFFLMYVSGISLNIMSLGGLTLGIGLLVDNSIVVLEAIQRKREEGLNVLEAAEHGASEVGQAVIASTMTTICVFIPIVFVEGVAGQLFGDQALAVAYSLGVSLIVALTLIPMLASRHFENTNDGQLRPVYQSTVQRLAATGVFLMSLWVARFVKYVGLAVSSLLQVIFFLPRVVFDFLYSNVSRAYPRVLDFVLRHAFATILFALLLLGGSGILFGSLGRELIPELVQGQFYVSTELAPGTRLDVTASRLDRVESSARSIEFVRTVYAVIGTSREQGGIEGEERENVGELTLIVESNGSHEIEEIVKEQLRSVLNEGGDLEYRFGRPSYFSFRTPIEIEIRGYNLNLLRRLAEELTTRLSGIKGLVDIKSSTSGGSPELQVRFDRERLAMLGYTVNQVAMLIRAKILGDVATDITRQDHSIDIRIRADEEFRDSVEDLRNLNIAQGGQVAIPLSSVADVLEVDGPTEIRRSDGERTALITANLVGRDLGSVSDDINEELAGMVFPVGFDWRVGGQRQEMETSFGSMRLAIFLAIFMVYLVMASQFESLLHPFVIIFSVPLSVIGVLLTLYLFKITISIVVLIGMILLAGIVVNNAIILVDYTNRLRRQGMVKLDALRSAAGIRLRPILMVTSTTILGLLPMAIGIGEGSELRTPMAVTVIGGLFASTLLTLLIIPAVYSLLDRGR